MIKFSKLNTHQHEAIELFVNEEKDIADPGYGKLIIAGMMII